MHTIVVSGVNLTEGGILSILEDCLRSLKLKHTSDNLKIIVLVNSKKLVSEYLNDFEIYEYPAVKTSWLKRIKFEYITSKEISKQFKPDLWISLHDMTPNVDCRYQVVYCHNPSPFYNLPLKEANLDFKFFLFNKFYKYLYGINIKKNKFAIVQQNWLREEFERRYNVKSIVAHPSIETTDNQTVSVKDIKKPFMFFYPSFPRLFKNFETLLKAAVKLSEKRSDFEVTITISGTENKYSRRLLNQFSKYPFIKFIGLQPRKKVFEIYNDCDCLVFPSKLETWGLPLSEFKHFGKPILAADLPYAKETIGDHNQVKFFGAENDVELANFMDLTIDNKLQFDENKQPDPDQPFFSNWDSLLTFLINSSKSNEV